MGLYGPAPAGAWVGPAAAIWATRTKGRPGTAPAEICAPPAPPRRRTRRGAGARRLVGLVAPGDRPGEGPPTSTAPGSHYLNLRIWRETVREVVPAATRQATARQPLLVGYHRLGVLDYVAVLVSACADRSTTAMDTSAARHERTVPSTASKRRAIVMVEHAGRRWTGKPACWPIMMRIPAHHPGAERVHGMSAWAAVAARSISAPSLGEVRSATLLAFKSDSFRNESPRQPPGPRERTQPGFTGGTGRSTRRGPGRRSRPSRGTAPARRRRHRAPGRPARRRSPRRCGAAALTCRRRTACRLRPGRATRRARAKLEPKSLDRRRDRREG